MSVSYKLKYYYYVPSSTYRIYICRGRQVQCFIYLFDSSFSSFGDILISFLFSMSHFFICESLLRVSLCSPTARFCSCLQCHCPFLQTTPLVSVSYAILPLPLLLLLPPLCILELRASKSIELSATCFCINGDEEESPNPFF